MRLASVEAGALASRALKYSPDRLSGGPGSGVFRPATRRLKSPHQFFRIEIRIGAESGGRGVVKNAGGRIIEAELVGRREEILVFFRFLRLVRLLTDGWIFGRITKKN